MIPLPVESETVHINSPGSRPCTASSGRSSEAPALRSRRTLSRSRLLRPGSLLRSESDSQRPRALSSSCKRSTAVSSIGFIFFHLFVLFLFLILEVFRPLPPSDLSHSKKQQLNSSLNSSEKTSLKQLAEPGCISTFCII